MDLIRADSSVISWIGKVYEKPKFFFACGGPEQAVSTRLRRGATTVRRVQKVSAKLIFVRNLYCTCMATVIPPTGTCTVPVSPYNYMLAYYSYDLHSKQLAIRITYTR